jgi:hypothetical protein
MLISLLHRKVVIRKALYNPHFRTPSNVPEK